MRRKNLRSIGPLPKAAKKRGRKPPLMLHLPLGCSFQRRAFEYTGDRRCRIYRKPHLQGIGKGRIYPGLLRQLVPRPSRSRKMGTLGNWRHSRPRPSSIGPQTIPTNSCHALFCLCLCRRVGPETFALLPQQHRRERCTFAGSDRLRAPTLCFLIELRDLWNVLK